MKMIRKIEIMKDKIGGNRPIKAKDVLFLLGFFWWWWEGGLIKRNSKHQMIRMLKTFGEMFKF